MNKKIVPAIACLVLLGVTGMAMAAEILGGVTAIEKRLVIGNITAPSVVDPTNSYQFTWDLAYSEGICHTIEESGRMKQDFKLPFQISYRVNPVSFYNQTQVGIHMLSVKIETKENLLIMTLVDVSEQ